MTVTGTALGDMEGREMRPFLAGIVCAVIVGAAAALILSSLELSSADVYRSRYGSVRL
jgi:hypothetical protein